MNLKPGLLLFHEILALMGNLAALILMIAFDLMLCVLKMAALVAVAFITYAALQVGDMWVVYLFAVAGYGYAGYWWFVTSRICVDEVPMVDTRMEHGVMACPHQCHEVSLKYRGGL